MEGSDSDSALVFDTNVYVNVVVGLGDVRRRR